MDNADLREEELEELDVLERLYAMLHYADDTQQNVEQNNQNHSNTDSAPSITPKSSVRRYWHTSGDEAPVNTQFQKVNPQKPSNTPKNVPPARTNYMPTLPSKNIPPITKPKEETPTFPKRTLTSDLASFGSPLAKGTKTTIKIEENDDIVCMDLETSDEDEVIEVALPPKPTITIVSSDDDDEISVVQKLISKPEKQASKNEQGRKRPSKSDSRDICSSPVPSVVSSVSDDFIRGDCIALNITSRCPDNPSFDFSLHGSDLLDTPSKKKKKKKNKKRSNNFTGASTTELPEKNVQHETDLFATPKNKAKNKRQQTKTYTVSDNSVPNPDIYDSDSNQSFDNNKKQTYAVTYKSLPCTDVYESDSSQSEITKVPNKVDSKQPECYQVGSCDSSESLNKEKKQETSVNLPPTRKETPDTRVQGDQRNASADTSVVDLTDELDETVLQNDSIEENIVMANVTGFEECDDYGDQYETPKDPLKLGSTKVPAILFSDLDFDNLKRNEKVCKKQRYSLTKLRAEMEKFYNESWGGEDFNHREIQKSMSRDKSLWEIDAKDRMPSPYRRKITCNYCNRAGHRDDTCRLKPPVCYMCGDTGHHEPRCPHKICVNCGSPNYMYSSICRNCSNWGRVTCAECHQRGHPSSHCPDLWRRYHDTIDNNAPLVQALEQRKHWQQFCSGCSRRGHLVHTCRLSLPFSGLPINSPYVVRYKPVYPPTNRTEQFADENDKALQNKPSPRANKRQSNSPAAHETHAKKRRESAGDNLETRASKSVEKRVGENTTQPVTSTPHRKRTQSENADQKQTPSSHIDFQNTQNHIPSLLDVVIEPTLDYIPISSSNHDKKGQMIQDNEVSDTTDVKTSARVLVTNAVLEKLKTKDGQIWLMVTSVKHSVQVAEPDNVFLNVKGKVADLEAFQVDLKEWMSPKKDESEAQSTQELEDPTHLSDNIPKNRNNVLRKLLNAFQSLQQYIGNPKELFKELQYHQRNHYILEKQRIISPQKLSNSTDHINQMVTKLNMILLGQAGLADGSLHMNQLHNLHQRLSVIRTNKISLEMRKEIGQHFQSIFTAMPRTDYSQLLAKYYETQNSHEPRAVKGSKKKKKKKHNQQMTPKMSPFTGAHHAINKKQRVKKISLDKLTFYHRRLLNDGSKKSVELARKFHAQISSFKKNETLSPKAMKKVKKLQEQANLFLK